MSGITRAPSLLSLSVSLLAATASLAAGATTASAGLPVAALGVVVLAVGLFRGSRRLVTAGGVFLFAALLLAGAAGASPAALVLGVLFAVLAWDVGEHGIVVGEQLGREADTTRVELAHAAVTLAVGATATAVGYGLYRAAAGGQPVTALVFLLLGLVALVAALR